MADGKVVYQIVGDSKGLPADMAKAEGIIKQSVGSWDDIVSGVVSGIGAAFAAAVAAGGAALAALGKQGLEYNAQVEKYRTAFATLLGDMEKAADLMEQIKSDAAVTPFDVQSLTQAVQLLVAADINAADARLTILALGDAIAATGGGDDELLRMAQNLQQVSNVGKASAVDVKQFAMAGINIYKTLADYLGITAQEAAAMEITFEDLQNALIAAADEGGQYFGAMAEQSKTLNGAVSNLGDSFGQFSGRVTERLAQAAVGVVTALSDMLNSVSPFEDAIKSLFDAIADGVTARIPMMRSGFESLSAAIGTILPKIGEMREYMPDISDAVSLITPAVEQLKFLLPVLGTALEGLLAPLKGISTEALPAARIEFEELLIVLSELTATILPAAASFIGELLASISQLAINILPVLLSAIKSLLKPLGELISDILPPLSKALNSILPILESLFKNAVNPIAKALEKIFPILSEIVGSILGALSDLIVALTPAFESLFKQVSPLVNLCGDLAAAVLNLISAFGPLGAVLKDILIIVFGDFIEALGQSFALINDIANVIIGDFIDALNKSSDVVRDFGTFIKLCIEGDVAGAFKMLDAVVQPILAGFKKSLESLKSFAQGVAESIKSFFSGIGDVIGGAIDDVKDFFTGESKPETSSQFFLPGTNNPGNYYASSAAEAASYGTAASGNSSRTTVLTTVVEIDGRAVGQSTMTYLDDTVSTTVRG